ncbi:MAG: hypothetical protein ACRDTF_09350 [Pseudonocardiaceae bacterium]
MPPIDWPREADSEQTTEPRRVALDDLAGLLRGQGFTVDTETWHLVNVERRVTV